MKSDRKTKKLGLFKNTIANLANEKIAAVYGGGNPRPGQIPPTSWGAVVCVDCEKIPNVGTR